MATIDCRVCQRMHNRKPHWKQPGPSKRCVLCNNLYCETHKATSPQDVASGLNVCEINHKSYYLGQKSKYGADIFPSVKAFEEAAKSADGPNPESSTVPLSGVAVNRINSRGMLEKSKCGADVGRSTKPVGDASRHANTNSAARTTPSSNIAVNGAKSYEMPANFKEQEHLLGDDIPADRSHRQLGVAVDGVRSRETLGRMKGQGHPMGCDCSAHCDAPSSDPAVSGVKSRGMLVKSKEQLHSTNEVRAPRSSKKVDAEEGLRSRNMGVAV